MAVQEALEQEDGLGAVSVAIVRELWNESHLGLHPEFVAGIVGKSLSPSESQCYYQ